MNKIVQKIIKKIGIGILLVFPCFVMAEQPQKIYSISGRWSLDEKRSDQVYAKVAKALEFFNPAKVRLVQSKNQVYALGDFIEEATTERVDDLYNYLDNIVPLASIKSTNHQNPLFTIHYEDGRIRTVYTDGRSANDNLQTTAIDKDQYIVLSSWENKRLSIETNTLSGARIEETYLLFRQGGKVFLQNVHTVNTSKLDKPLMFVRYYLYDPSIVPK